VNVVIIEGTLTRAPEARTLASGAALVACEVTVRDEGEPTETVPIAWFDPPASASRLVEGTAVIVTGRIRRRFFRAGGATVSRTEVVASTVVPSRGASRRAAILGRARDALDPTAGP
jgi:single-strand DNA-binding protein